IALGLAVLFVLGVRRAERVAGSEPALVRRRVFLAALGVASWMGLIALAAASGVLGRFDLRPPPMVLWFATVLGSAVLVGLSSWGKRLAAGLPFAALVGFQAFRLPLELVMHQAANDGLMPSVMSFNGYNFDIVSGISAALVACLIVLEKAPRWLIVAWNALGSALLLAIATIAMLASPVIRAFGDDQLNVWVTRFPYCWMAVMVAAALFGHLLVARKLLAERGPARSRAVVSSPI
ncbi:MAG TPA: hypothetical protein VGK73_31165, partial [Polyangiaceae bacterium]